MKQATSPAEAEDLIREGREKDILFAFPCSRALLWDFSWLAEKRGVSVALAPGFLDGTVPGSGHPLYGQALAHLRRTPALSWAECLAQARAEMAA